MPEFSIQSKQIWDAATAARDRVLPRTADPFDAIVAVVLSAAATEAFINEIPFVLQKSPLTLPPRLQTLAETLSDIEDSHGSLTLKYLIAGHVLERPFDRGSQPFQDFSALVRLRNDVMHVKQEERFVESPDSDAHVKRPGYMRGLHQKGLLRMRPDTQDFAWLSSFDAVQTPEIASWACDTSQAMVQAVLDCFPDGTPHEDPIFVIKLSWQIRRVFDR